MRKKASSISQDTHHPSQSLFEPASRKLFRAARSPSIKSDSIEMPNKLSLYSCSDNKRIYLIFLINPAVAYAPLLEITKQNVIYKTIIKINTQTTVLFSVSDLHVHILKLLLTE